MEEKRKPRVLVTYIESGYGHIMSAQAIARGWRKNTAAKWILSKQTSCRKIMTKR